MTRFAIDARTAIELARVETVVAAEHRLVAPSVLQSHVLAILYRDARDGKITAKEARRLMDRITSMRIRLLGDRVSRATAWRIAEQLDWNDIGDAEYVAVAQLQADAFVTLDPELAARVHQIVPIATLQDLRAN